MPVNKRILHSIDITNDWVTVEYTNQQGERTTYGCAKCPFVLLIENEVNQSLLDMKQPVRQKKRK